MPKGQMPKLKGSICNVPIDTAAIANTLPQGVDSNGIIMMKLKRKLVYRGHVYFEAGSPESVRSALESSSSSSFFGLTSIFHASMGWTGYING